MGILEIVIGIVLVFLALLLIGVIMLQEGTSRGMGGAMSGGSSESYIGSNKGRTYDAILARITKISAVVFLILTVVMGILSVLNK